MATLILSTVPGVTPEDSTIKIVRKKKTAKARVLPVQRTARPKPAPSKMPAVRRQPRAPVPAPRAPVPPAPQLIPSAADQTNVGGKTKVVPWITLGASAVAGAVGAIYVTKTFASVNRLSELEPRANGGNFSGGAVSGTITIPQEYQDQQRAVFTNGLAATVLISSGTAGAIASIISLLD